MLPEDTVFRLKIAPGPNQTASKSGGQPEKAKHALQLCQITSPASRVKLLITLLAMTLARNNDAQGFAWRFDSLLRISTLPGREDTSRLIQGFT